MDASKGNWCMMYDFACCSYCALKVGAEVERLKNDLLITSSMDVLLINLFSALPAPYSEISPGFYSLSF